MNIEKLLETIKDNKYSVVAIRHCCPDEHYQVGDFCRNSYEWDYELECSSYDTENPIELDGACGYALFDLLEVDDTVMAEKVLDDGIENSNMYSGTEIVIIAGTSYTYGNDENEVIIEYPEVVGVI